jgi:hypothetical protein
MKFKCACCDEIIEGIPTFGASKPLHYFDVPEDKIATDVFLTKDLCVIAEQFFFVRGCLEIPVLGHDEPFIWGVWSSLAERDFMEYQELLDTPERSHYGPYFGWLSARIHTYPDTENLQTTLRVRNRGIRPLIEVEKNGHPLALEQENGISLGRVAEIYAAVMHGK